MAIAVKCDLRASFGEARDQLERPTCMCFASSDVNAERHSPYMPLSCEYLHYHAVQRAGVAPHEAASIKHVLAALEHDGQPAESVWPYLSTLPADLGTWKPPAAPAALWRSRGQTALGSLDDVTGLLGQGKPPVIVVSISDAFFSPTADGVVDGAEAVDNSIVHALVAVGHGERGTERFLLVRNSWGTLWGVDGYGWVSETYLSPRLLRIIEIKA